MVNLLYMAIYGNTATKQIAFTVLTDSRELSAYCQESVRPTHSRHFAEALQNLQQPEAMDLIVQAVIADNARKAIGDDLALEDGTGSGQLPAYLQAMNVIETALD